MLECGLRAVVLHNKEVVWNYYAEFTADCRRINTKAKNSVFSGIWVKENNLGALTFADCNGNNIYIQITPSGTINLIDANNKRIFPPT